MPQVDLKDQSVKRSVALAGATGLVGRSILEGLLADRSVQAVHVLARRKPRVADARITCHIVDFSALPALPPVDEVYLALGTTIKVAGNQAAFRAVDFDANLAVARAALVGERCFVRDLRRRSRTYGVTLNVGRGYDVWDSIHNAARRFGDGEGQTMLYFGDFDPSGEDMVRSLRQRLAFFACRPTIVKSGLVADNIARYHLPLTSRKRPTRGELLLLPSMAMSRWNWMLCQSKSCRSGCGSRSRPGWTWKHCLRLRPLSRGIGRYWSTLSRALRSRFEQDQKYAQHPEQIGVVPRT